MYKLYNSFIVVEPDLKIEDELITEPDENIDVKTEDNQVKAEISEPNGTLSISSVIRTTRSMSKACIDFNNDVQPKIESVFLDDDDYQQPDVMDITIEDIKYEENLDIMEWQNDDDDDDSSHDIRLETITTEFDDKSTDAHTKQPLQIVTNTNHRKPESSEDAGDLDDVYDDMLKSTKSQSTNSKHQSPNRKPEMERCIPCNRKFHDLSKHWVEFHSGIERPFECFICHKNYKRLEHIRYHMKIHGDERNYICHVCGDAFFVINELRKHIMNRHQVERPYKCTYQMCKKCFKNQHALNVHMRTHSGIKPHICVICSESFAALSSLKIHERKHTGEKPYVCKFCQKAFADCSTHRQHVRIHTGDKPYKCHLCDRRTAQAGNLKSHYRHYHKIIVKSVSMFMDQPNSDDIRNNSHEPNHRIPAYSIETLMDQTRRIEE